MAGRKAENERYRPLEYMSKAAEAASLGGNPMRGGLLKPTSFGAAFWILFLGEEKKYPAGGSLIK